MVGLSWWQWLGSLLLVTAVSPVITRLVDRWANRKEKQRRLLTEDAFRTFFNESILPDLERTIRTIIERSILPDLRRTIRTITEEELRARVQARHLRRRHDDLGPQPS